MNDELVLNQTNLITFVLIDSGNVEVAGLGTTFTVSVAKGVNAFVLGTGTKSEIGSGWYGYELTANECDSVGALAVKAIGAGTVQQNLSYFVGGANAGAEAFTYTLTSTEGGTPIEGASVWVTTDSAGNHTIASGTTDAAGVVTFYLQAGTYYVWRAHSGYSFSNPDVETISA